MIRSSELVFVEKLVEDRITRGPEWDSVIWCACVKCFSLNRSGQEFLVSKVIEGSSGELAGVAQQCRFPMPLHGKCGFGYSVFSMREMVAV